MQITNMIFADYSKKADFPQSNGYPQIFRNSDLRPIPLEPIDLRSSRPGKENRPLSCRGRACSTRLQGKACLFFPNVIVDVQVVLAGIIPGVIVFHPVADQVAEVVRIAVPEADTPV